MKRFFVKYLERENFFFIGSFFICLLVYRLLLTWQLYEGESIMQYRREWTPWSFFFQSVLYDLLFLLIIGCGYYVISFFFLALKKEEILFSKDKWEKGLKIGLRIFVYLFVLSFGFASAVHFHVIDFLSFPLTLESIIGSRYQLPLEEVVRSIRGIDLYFWLLPVIGVILFDICYHRIRVVFGSLLLVLSIVAVATGCLVKIPISSIDPTLRFSPVFYTVIDSMVTDRNRLLDGIENEISEAQKNSLAFIDPYFFRKKEDKNNKENKKREEILLQRAENKEPNFSGNQKPNIILIVVESLASRYFGLENDQGEKATPFLHQLSEDGVYLANHYATSNGSPKALFSLLTGLYPESSKQEFTCLPDNRIPILPTLLGEEYDSFLVTPTSTKFFFPRGLCLNNGVQIYDRDEIPPGVPADVVSTIRNEHVAVDFFIEKIQSSSEPFVGIYFSFLAHFNYDDYGEKYRIFKDTTDPLNRYLNNLNVIDCLVKRIYQSLEKSGKLENTIVVVTGDHGQSFGENGYRFHTNNSFNNVLQAPVIVYAPQFLKKTKIDKPTSHVDLTPTLVDLLGKKSKENPFQGESLLRPLSRRFIFTFGEEDTLCSISEEEIKMVLKFRKSKIETYDLKVDPYEKNDLGAEGHQEQQKASKVFAVLQSKNLRRYNQEKEEE